MNPSSFLALALTVAVAGCLSTSERQGEPIPDPTAPVQASAGKSASFRFNLSTVGSLQVGERYFHPGVGQVHDSQDYNCVWFDLADVDLAGIHATASWTSDGVTDRLRVYHWFKEDSSPPREHGHTDGTSPVNHSASFVEPARPQYLIVGVDPASDLPAGAGTVDHVGFVVSLDHAGKTAPTVRALRYCSYDPEGPPVSREAPK